MIEGKGLLALGRFGIREWVIGGGRGDSFIGDLSWEKGFAFHCSGRDDDAVWAIGVSEGVKCRRRAHSIMQFFFPFHPFIYRTSIIISDGNMSNAKRIWWLRR